MLIAYNVGSGFSRMGIEAIGQDPQITDDSRNLLVKCNRFANWNNPVNDGNTMAYSIVVNGGTGTQVVNNYAQAKVDTGYGIELSGPNAIAKGDYIDGFHTGIIGYAPGDIIEENNLINSAGPEIDTYGRTDEIVRNNTSNPRAPLSSCLPGP